MLVCQRVILEVSGRPFNHIKPPKPFRRVEKDLQGCSLVPFWTISSRNNEINFYTHLPYLTEGFTRNGARKSGSLHERKVSRLIDKPQKLAVCKPIPMDSHSSLYTHQKSHSLYTILYIPIKKSQCWFKHFMRYNIYMFFFSMGFLSFWDYKPLLLPYPRCRPGDIHGHSHMAIPRLLWHIFPRFAARQVA